MARKFDLISELYERTCFAVTDNPVNWQSFLKTAGRNFRLRFDEQLLIYAQRPDATGILGVQTAGASVGSAISPSNIILGTTTAGILGKEGEVLKRNITLAIPMVIAFGMIFYVLSEI